jgi:cell division transport system permease protein
MSRFVSTERIFKNGAVGFLRNIWLAIAAIAMMAITLTILLFAVVANSTFRHTIADITSHIDVSIYLKDDVTSPQLNQLTGQLKGLPDVKLVSYVSKDQALKNYQQQNINNTDLLSAISETGNVLPASLTLKPTNPNNMQGIKTFLEKPEIQSLQSYPTSYSGDRKSAIDKITSATHFFEQAGVIGIVVFIIISMLIIFNTIRMAIFNRRDELVIMRLLGASPWYIRGPFIVETMIYGVIAAGISIGLCSALFAVASTTLQASSLGLLDISYANNFFTGHLLVISFTQVGIGVVIGAASSALATKRYLKLNK